jgi:hypothetical protein
MMTEKMMKNKKPQKPKRWDAILKRLPNGVLITGAEIGVKAADTSKRLLQARPLLTLIMVDPWEVPKKGSSYDLSDDDNAHKSQTAHETHYKISCDAVKFAGARAVIKRMYSVEAAKQVPDKSLDFVFIDGDHSYVGCSHDIKLWLPKIKSGGFISGHDYAHPRLPGVKKAVDEMFNNPTHIELDVNRTWFVRV